MDLSALRDARNAVAKISKDYQPIANLAAVLDEVSKVASQVEDLDNVLAKRNAELKSAEEQLAYTIRMAESKKSELAESTRQLAEVRAAIAKLAAA